jgi:hypothetical protein
MKQILPCLTDPTGPRFGLVGFDDERCADQLDEERTEL